MNACERALGALLTATLCGACYTPSRTIKISGDGPGARREATAPTTADPSLERSKQEAAARRCERLPTASERAACMESVAPADRSAAAPANDASDDGLQVTFLVSAAELGKLGISRVAVPRVEGAGISADMVKVLSDAAVDAAARTRGVTVIGASDIDSLLGFERQKELVGCDDASCMAEVAGALGVDAILVVKVGKLGDTFRISAALMDIRGARALMRGAARSQDVNDLLDLFDALVPRVMHPIGRGS